MCDLESKMMDFFACKKREKTGVYDFSHLPANAAHTPNKCRFPHHRQSDGCWLSESQTKSHRKINPCANRVEHCVKEQ